MPNTQACSACLLYHAIIKPHRKGGEPKNLKRGYCLDQTVFASNRPGDPVYPPRAKTAVLPFAQHSVVLRREDEVVGHCNAFKHQKG